MSDKLQYKRRFNLILSNADGDALDVSSLRVVFKIKKTDSQTPNTSEVRIYNLSDTTQTRIQKEFSSIIIQAGYDMNFGVIFSGNIKEIITGKENGVDTYLDISAGDGDESYNFSVINTTISEGANQYDQINVAAEALKKSGVGIGYIDNTNSQKLPRGKVMYGMARDYLRQSSQTTGSTWSIQDGKLQIINKSGLLPNQAVILNQYSGLIGDIERTTDGTKARALLNPLLKIGGQIKIEDNSIDRTGIYRLLSVEHIGDTMGNDWYSDMICLTVNISAPIGEQVAKV